MAIYIDIGHDIALYPAMPLDNSLVCLPYVHAVGLLQTLVVKTFRTPTQFPLFKPFNHINK